MAWQFEKVFYAQPATAPKQIAFDGKYIAADRLGVRNDRACPNPVSKIVKAPNGCVMAVAGAIGDHFKKFCNWAQNNQEGEVPYPEDDNTTYVLFHKSGVIQEFLSDKYSTDLTSHVQYAWGSGSSYALGAMASGKSAKQAVEIATKFDIYTGRGIDVIKLR